MNIIINNFLTGIKRDIQAAYGDFVECNHSNAQITEITSMGIDCFLLGWDDMNDFDRLFYEEIMMTMMMIALMMSALMMMMMMMMGKKRRKKQ